MHRESCSSLRTSKSHIKSRLIGMSLKAKISPLERWFDIFSVVKIKNLVLLFLPHSKSKMFCENTWR